MKKDEEEKRKPVRNVNEVYDTDPEGTYSKAGREEMGSLPNDPAKNAKRTSPEEDSGRKEDTRLRAKNTAPKK
jgi:hypothetical protein